MSALVSNNKELVQEYLDTLCSASKTVEVIDRFVADPLLKQHILEAEAAFPRYRLVIERMVAEVDIVAVQATMNAVHGGTFAGIQPTGRTVSAVCMLFYRIAQDAYHPALDATRCLVPYASAHRLTNHQKLLETTSSIP